MNNNLTRYEAARQALAECKNVDEVKDFKNKWDALREYAKRAKKRELLIYAVEISARAERCLGQMLIEAFENGELGHGHKGKNSPPKNGGLKKLEDLGVTTQQSSRAQQLAKISEPDFEGLIGLWRQKSEEGNRVTVDMLAFAHERSQDESDDQEEDDQEEDDQEESDESDESGEQDASDKEEDQDKSGKGEEDEEDEDEDEDEEDEEDEEDDADGEENAQDARRRGLISRAETAIKDAAHADWRRYRGDKEVLVAVIRAFRAWEQLLVYLEKLDDA